MAVWFFLFEVKKLLNEFKQVLKNNERGNSMKVAYDETTENLLQKTKVIKTDLEFAIIKTNLLLNLRG